MLPPVKLKVIIDNLLLLLPRCKYCNDVNDPILLGIVPTNARLYNEICVTLAYVADPFTVPHVTPWYEHHAGKLADIESLMQLVKKQFGQLDILFVNAGTAQAAPFELVSEEQFDIMVTTNFKGAFFTIQKALPLLTKNASIIVTTSITNQMGTPNFSVYGACKAALRSLVQTLGLELVGRGIRINAISPGPIDTPMFGRIGLPDGAEKAIKAEIISKSPIKRFASPDEVAKVALFLATEDSSYIIGDEIVVDGGMSLL